MSREYFNAYHSYLDSMKRLSDAEVGRLFRALLKYSMTGTLDDLPGNERFVVDGMTAQIDRDSKRYDEKCETNRRNGALGGKANGSERKRTPPERPPNAPQGKGKGKGKGEGEGEGKKGKCAREARPTPADWGFGPDLTATFEDWLRYKREKRQEYKPTGLKSLVTQIKSHAEKYGDDAVVALIRECMAANWQGIIWDRLERPRQAKTTGNGAFDPQPTQDRIQKNNDWMDQFLEKQGGAKE